MFSAVLQLAARVLARRQSHPTERALVVAVSGIDGSGKSWLGARLVEALRAAGTHAVLAPGDEWLRIPGPAVDGAATPEAYYASAVRHEDLLAQLVRPIARRRAATLAGRLVAAPDGRLQPRDDAWRDVEILVVEGVFLFKPHLRDEFDVRVWVECPEREALRRSLERLQEGLPPDEVRRRYASIYFPAQRRHLAADGPRAAAHWCFVHAPGRAREPILEPGPASRAEPGISS